ncbi:hypothetical protein MUP77_14130 [Candidatus Bathyarchaeota archaeon]|nr:hypothetical protein [Candidatus Bathyarchaeota archaeon]
MRLIEEQNKTIEKMQGQIDMMMQGLVERDNAYFERKYPRLKNMREGQGNRGQS